MHISSDILAAFDEELRGSLIGDKASSAIFDNTKIKRYVPGFAATIPFKQGIQRTIKWFEADTARQIIRSETNSWMEKVIDQYDRMLASSKR